MNEVPLPTGLLIAHGSPDPRHAAAIRELTAHVAASVAPMTCDLAFLDHDDPLLATWLESPAGTNVRAIGLLLSSGYHAQFDIPQALGAAEAVQVTDLGPLGAGEWLPLVLERNVAEVGGTTHSPVVLVSAGSTQESARHDLRTVCARWAAQRAAPVLPAAVTGPDPRPDEVVATVAVPHADVVVVPLMLAPGALADRAANAAGAAGARCASTITSEDRTPPELVAHLAARLTTG